jgi:hypothetical protein
MNVFFYDKNLELNVHFYFIFLKERKTSKKKDSEMIARMRGGGH